MYTLPKQTNCLGHTVVNAGSPTALTGVPVGTELMVIQPKGGSSFYWTDTPSAMSSITSEGIEVPDKVSYVYAGNFQGFQYQGQALLMFYGSRR